MSENHKRPPSPPEGERKYYRHSSTGDRGFIVEYPDGTIKMRYCRGESSNYQRDVDFSGQAQNRWISDRQTLPAQPHQLGHLCFVADRELCRVIGLKRQADAKWEDLRPETRRKWVTDGPTVHPHRKRLWAAIMLAVGDLAEIGDLNDGE